LIALVSSVDLSPTLASTAGFVVSAAINYMLNYTFTFRSTARHSAAIVKFALVALIGLSLNAALMKAGTDGLDINYLVVQTVAIGCVVIWNFLANKHWTFGRAERVEDPG
jgi:putative flippase GtrA